MGKEFKLVSATGMLGSGFQAESITKAIELGAQMIGCDAGSTDAGPNALATGKCQFSYAAVKRDLANMLLPGLEAGIPVIVGSAGTAGSDASLEWLVGIVKDLAKEHGLHFKLAKIRSEISKDIVLEHLREGKVRPLAPSAPLTTEEVEQSLHIVCMMGAEPIQEALRAGAQVIVTGRSSDTSIYAAYPLMLGFDPAVVWHMAKIMECGAAAVTVRISPDSMMAVLHEDSFDIFPLRDDYRSTPQSIASHTLYENADPFNLVEPSGTLMTKKAKYAAISDRAVNVTGSQFHPCDEYTIKIEGVRQSGWSSLIIGAVRDPYIIKDLDAWLAQLNRSIDTRLRNTIGDKHYEVITRVYGKNGVMGDLEPTTTISSHEVCIIWDIISESQDLSHTIASSISHLAVHNPIEKWNGLISGVAFPFSPSEVDRGPVYEFHLNHVLVPESPTSLFKTEMENV